MSKIVHVMIVDKFLPSFIDLVCSNFDVNEHKFFFWGERLYEFGLNESHPVEWVTNEHDLEVFVDALENADKIILHGLWVEEVNQILNLKPWLLRKSYWFMWGGDYWFPERHTWAKSQVIKNVKAAVTFNIHSYKQMKEWYQSKSHFIECFLYRSNVFDCNLFNEIVGGGDGFDDNSVNVLIGNSSNPTNNHFEALEMLLPYKNENIRVIAPLSYGCSDSEYIKSVDELGKQYFGNKFKPIHEYVPYSQYLSILKSVDVALFLHDRPQAMGNIISLLGLGKRVYVKETSVSYRFFKEIGVKIMSLSDFFLSGDNESCSESISRVAAYFSEENLVSQLSGIFTTKT